MAAAKLSMETMGNGRHTPAGIPSLSSSGGEARSCLHAAGSRLRLSTPLTCNSEEFFPVYEAAEELGLPILFHVGISARFIPEHDRWNTSSRFMMPLTLDRIARCFPDLTIWGAHLGYPDTWHAAELMRRHPRVFFDICGLPDLPTLAPWSELFRDEAHWGKLIYGSEGGPAGFAPLRDRYRRLMDEAGVSAEVQRRVFWDNAAEVLGL